MNAVAGKAGQFLFTPDNDVADVLQDVTIRWIQLRDRGVGKTSLALTSAFLHTGIENLPIYVMCGRTNNFSQTIQAIGNSLVPVEQRLEKAASGEGLADAASGCGYDVG